MKALIFQSLLICAFCLFELQAIELKVEEGDVYFREAGASFKKIEAKEMTKLKENVIVKAPYGLVGSFQFSGASAKVDSELIFKLDANKTPMLLQGTLTLKVTSELEIHTPSCELSLSEGEYALSIMEGYGVLNCLKGSGKAIQAQSSLQFNSEQKVVFSHKGKLELK